MKKTLARFLVVIGLTVLSAGFIAKISYELPLENKRFFDFSHGDRRLER